jgi:hypothetical protein
MEKNSVEFLKSQNNENNSKMDNVVAEMEKDQTSNEDLNNFSKKLNENVDYWSEEYLDNTYDLADDIVDFVKENKDKKYIVTFTDLNGERRGITLHSNNIKAFRDKILNPYTENPVEKFSSDAIEDFEHGYISDVVFTEIPSTRKKNLDGRFFAYNNLTKFDLRKYQIYTKENRPNNNDHCLLKAFSESKLLTKEELDKIKVMLAGCNYPKSFLKEFTKKFDFVIKLSYFSGVKIENDYFVNGLTKSCKDENSPRSVAKIKELITDKRVIELGLYENHYFINEISPICHSSAVNWKSLPFGEKNSKGELYDCNRLEKNGKYWKKVTKDIKIRVLSLLDALLKNDAFEILDLEDFLSASTNDVKETNYTISYPPYINKIDNSIDYDGDKLDKKKSKKKEVDDEIIDEEMELVNKSWLTNFAAIVFADCETSTNSEKHEVYINCWQEAYSNCFVDSKKITEDYKKENKIMTSKELNMIEKSSDFNEYLKKFKEAELETKKKTLKRDILKQYIRVIYKQETELTEEMFLDLTEKIQKEKMILMNKFKNNELTDFVKLHVEHGDTTMNKFLNTIKDNSLIYFHNLKYDWQQIYKDIKILSSIESDGQIYEIVASFYGKKLTFRDSYKILPQALTSFTGMFKLDAIKEVFPYNFYTTDNVGGNCYFEVSQVEDALVKEFEHKNKWNTIKYEKTSDYDKALENELNSFRENIKKSDSIISRGRNKGKMDIMKYAKYYCDHDVDLLRKGMMKFRELCKEFFNMDTFNYRSISSISDNYFINSGCYKGVDNLEGLLRDFVQKSIIGGVVASKENKTWLIEVPIVDNDAVSLYPSAMNRIEGFPLGKAKIIRSDKYEDIKNYNHYVVEIKVTKVNKNFGIPMLGYKDKKSKKRIWTNECPNENIIVDKLYLEDLIKFQEVEFEILRGVYWNNGFNNLIVEKIKYIFDKRIEFKKSGNLLEQVCKLIMNTAYGKTIIKAQKTRIIYKYGQDKFLKYLDKNYNMIKEYVELNTTSKASGEVNKGYKIFVIEPLINHSNRAHCGGIVLSMSKRIMNEVAYCASLVDAQIYYKDTDSMHMRQMDTEILGEKYKEIFNKELYGNYMGQFNSDFKTDKKDKDGKKLNVLYAKKTILMGPKMYCDELLLDNGDVDWHFRLKGVRPDSILKKAIEEYDKNIGDVYSSEKKITFDLTVRPVFRYIKGGGVKTEKNFERSIAFKKIEKYVDINGIEKNIE